MRTDPALPDFSREVYCLLGMPIDAVDLSGAEQRVRAAAERRSPCFLSTPNVNFLVTSRSDEAFRNTLVDSDLSVADGMPLVWLGRLLGIPLRERVAGSSLFDALRRGEGKPLSVFFFGGPEGAGEAASRQLALEGKGLKYAGHIAPGFGPVDEMSAESVIEQINAANADLLVVAVGARKGQAWIDRNRARLNVPVITYMGAVVHFAAGTVARAPAWMQTTGLEWLWRIKEQPSLWRRYLHDGLSLLALVVGKVLPQAWYLRRNRPAAEQFAAARADTRDEGTVHVIRLHGPWTRANSGRLRRCLHHAARARKDVRIEMQDVTHVDNAFVGLALLLHGYQRRNGRRLLMTHAPARVRRFIDWCGAGFLCTPATPPQPGQEVAQGDLSDPVPPS